MASGQLTLTILGSNSALPAHNRNPTAQLLDNEGSYFLIDCGEGTQMQLRRYHVKMQRIRAVFISHLHGDHYYGLLGLMNSMHLLGRKTPLAIYAPSKLKQIMEMQLEAGGGSLQYTWEFHATDHVHKQGGLHTLREDAKMTVQAFPVKHRIPCVAYIFRQKPKPRTYLPEEGDKVGVKVVDIPGIKDGADFTTADGTVIPNAQLTADPPDPRSYAYCTDTLPLKSTVDFVKGVDCLYHEATFLEDDRQRATQTFHTTARQAAEVAMEAGAGRLFIGHFSARYDPLNPLLEEAREIFPNTELAEEGKVFKI